MLVLYYLAIKLYGLVLLLISPFHKKAKLWVDGRKNIFEKIKKELKGKKNIWFHCSSYGEFEQGRPILDALFANFPEHKIIVTFFSPSAYENFKNKLSDYTVFYLPLDTPKNAKRFVNMVNPEFTVFIKNDIWFYYMRALYKKQIKFYFVSSLFKPSQIYFKWFSYYFQKQLNKAQHFFVQNQASLQLLYKHKITQVSVSGDTRFDRVFQNLNSNNNIAGINEFKNGKNILVAGSTWPAEEKMLIELANCSYLNYKFIIAPHEINENRIKALQSKITVNNVRYSERDNSNLRDAQVLIMDNVGYLSSLYKYAKVSIIGGGFGKGIHNILESVVFGAPTIFGPRYKNAKEAIELVNREKAFSIKNTKELKSILTDLEENELIYEEVSNVNKKYILENKGATSIIINQIKMDLGI